MDRRIWLPESETRAQTTPEGGVRVWTDMRFTPRAVGAETGFRPSPGPVEAAERPDEPDGPR